MVLTIPIKPVLWLIRALGHQELANDLSLKIVRILFHSLKAASGVDLQLRGIENLPDTDDDGVLFVGNHCSYFDIILSACAFKTCTGYIGKKELGRIPLLNTWMLILSSTCSRSSGACLAR